MHYFSTHIHHQFVIEVQAKKLDPQLLWPELIRYCAKLDVVDGQVC